MHGLHIHTSSIMTEGTGLSTDTLHAFSRMSCRTAQRSFAPPSLTSQRREAAKRAKRRVRGQPAKGISHKGSQRGPRKCANLTDFKFVPKFAGKVTGDGQEDYQDDDEGFHKKNCGKTLSYGMQSGRY